MLNTAMRNIGEWLYRNRIISLLITVWALTITTWVVYQVFGTSPPEIKAGTATAFATFFALPATAIGVWKWRAESKSTDRSSKKE